MRFSLYSNRKYQHVARFAELALLSPVGLSVRRTVLCGLSMGGYIAFEFLRRHRERVAGLVIMDARAEADSPERRARRNAMIASVLDRGSKALANEFAPKFLAESAPDEMKRELREMMERTPLSGIVGALQAMRDRPDSSPLLRTLASVPTLLLIGECDTRTPSSLDAGDSRPDSWRKVRHSSGRGSCLTF